VGSAASLAANVAVAQPTAAGRVIAAWPSFALIGAYELLMRQVRRNAAGKGKPQPRRLGPQVSQRGAGDTVLRRSPAHHGEAGGSGEGLAGRGAAGKKASAAGVALGAGPPRG